MPSAKASAVAQSPTLLLSVLAVTLLAGLGPSIVVAQVTLADPILVEANSSSSNVWSFTPETATLVDTMAADFEAGTVDICLYVAETGDGELMLAPAVGAEFSGAVLPAGWSAAPWATGGTATVGGGELTVDEARAWTDASYGPGSVSEFVATFGNAQYHYVGFAGDHNYATPWATFSTKNTSNSLYVRTNIGTSVDALIPGDWLGVPHTYRIEWLADRIHYYIDDALVHTESIAITSSMRPVISDYLAGAPDLAVDWLRMSPYADACTFESRIFDGGTTSNWLELIWTGNQPEGTTVSFETRSGNSPSPDGSWSDWAAVSGSIASPHGRYLQYRASLGSTVVQTTPVVEEVVIAYGDVPGPTAVSLASFAAEAGSEYIALSWETATEIDTLGFNLYRAESLSGPRNKINDGLIAAQMPGSPVGASYVYADEGVGVGVTYFYWLEEVEVDGKVTVHGPVEAELNLLRRLLPARPRPLPLVPALEAR